MVKNNNNKVMNNIQYFISSAMGICFGIGLIPTFFDDVYKVIVALLIVQIIISIIRGRLLNIFLEIFLVGLAGLSLIPLLGYVARFLGIIFCILEMASFKNGFLYQQMDMRTFNSKSGFKSKKPKSKKPQVKKPKVKFEDANFKEK